MRRHDTPSLFRHDEVPSTPWVGWVRAGRGQLWRRACGGQTEEECLTVLLSLRLPDGDDKTVTRGNDNPNLDRHGGFLRK